MTRKRQSGLSTVEFAIVALVLFMLIFGVIEVGRAFFVAGALDESARRGARMAAVCPINDPAIAQAAAFDNTLIPGLDATDVVIEYLDENAAIIADPTNPPSFRLIRYVRVRVVGFQHQMLVPLVAPLSQFTMPEYATVIPRESLGIPRVGAIVAC
ncbi:MAG: pilus assembly protein [Gammaproteobacteria bacterium]|nr:pilus assembly protein [Gammaproteobacteria bacterium]